jgi:predicted ATPase
VSATRISEENPIPASVTTGGGSTAPIQTPDQRLRVFVSSTLEELADERRAVSRAVSALRLTPVMFEAGARPQPPQDVYRAYLAQSDVFIGVYWERYGQVSPGTMVSGLEDEFERSRGLPRLLYVKDPAPDRESGLTELLSRIRREASYRHFRTAAELGRLVREDLATLLSERFAAGREPPGDDSSPPTLRTRRPLPVATTSLLGRDQAIEELAILVGGANARLVTLTGPGGIGKTRLALAVGERLVDSFGSGIAFVPLADVTEPEQVLGAIGRAVGAEVAGTDSPLDALAAHLADGRWLLILDNLEQVLGVAHDLYELLARCPGVAILATSRAVLGLISEQEFPVAPLAPPPEADSVPLDVLASWPAVALFVDRAHAVRHDFALTPANAPAVVEICRRLEGLPLAIELAAARTRLLLPAEVLRRLARSLDELGTGAADMPERQHTLRATVEWSVGLLGDGERSLLEVMAVFVGGWTVAAAAQVAGLEEDRALDLTEALAGHSLIVLDPTDRGPRCRMLDTIRAFVAERLAARTDADAVGRRHAEHYRAMVEQADRPLRSFGQSEWVSRLLTESGNLAATVRWYLSHDPTPLPHLFRVLSPFRVVWVFWGSRYELLVEARSWVEQLMPAADSLNPQAQAELLSTAAVNALEASDDEAAVAIRERLAPLLDRIGDPYVQAVSYLINAWTSSVVNDFDRAVREASVSLEKLRGQDEPLWTAIALMSVGGLEMAVGRFDDAGRHLTETRDLAERFDNDWLKGASRVRLGILELARGRLDDARALFDYALDLSLATDTAYNVILCLDAFSQLALAEGDPEQGALLAGAARGLRRRAGMQVFTSLTGEVQMVARIREALGANRFDKAFAAGSVLSREEALAAVRDHRGVARRTSLALPEHGQ